ncbi:protein neuralized isoform X2 [Bemisia tabaci]|uniref:protein neuralized isoform X2 n=1 Tax=Bemisia tabaci TaxID=7038 RepID=UPI0008F990F3|nr:PREDICTED: protein neuralized isoform X2 [Bemisia tabaci]
MGQSGSTLNQAQRSRGGAGLNNLPPLLFHQVHGENIQISRNGATAQRVESFCRGVTFSDRPVLIQEKVCIKFVSVSKNWSGVIRFGFTSNDPNNIRHGLPKYACPDLTNKPGYWAKALAERFAEENTVLFYYVTNVGDVHYGINGEEKGIFFTGVETRNPLWAMIDVYGNSTAIELLPDSRHQLNNAIRNPIHDSIPSVQRPLPSTDSLVTSLSVLNINNSNHNIYNESSAHANHAAQSTTATINGPLRYQDTTNQFHPFPFHKTKGRNVHLSPDSLVATRCDTEFCQGYVFTARPLRLGEKIVIQILGTDSIFLGALALGLTSCDPSTLSSADLPDDSDLLLDRPEYWVVSKDVAGAPKAGDELTLCISFNGEVQMSKNGSPPATLMHVDQTLRLWAFLDVYGSTQKIRLFGTESPVSLACSPPAMRSSLVDSQLRVSFPEQNHQNQLNQHNGGHRVHQNPPPPPSTSAPPRLRLPDKASGVQVGANGTVIVVNLSPAQSNYFNQEQATPFVTAQQSRILMPSVSHPSNPSGTMMSNCSHTYIEPVNMLEGTLAGGPSMQEWVQNAAHSNTLTGNECSICYERSIDSVLYMCGHMCMCYECAVQQWRGKGGGQCPMCRAPIRDVIRTYKS